MTWEIRPFDIMTVLEAVYAVQRDPRVWLRGVIDALEGGLDQGEGGCAYFVDVSDAEHPYYWGFVGPPETRKLWLEWFPTLPVEMQVAAHQSIAFGTYRGLIPHGAPGDVQLPPPFDDMLGVNGVGQDGRGISLAYLSRGVIRPPRGATADILTALSDHLARAAALVLPGALDLEPRVVGTVRRRATPPEAGPLGVAALRLLARRAIIDDPPMERAELERAWADLRARRLYVVDRFDLGGQWVTIAAQPTSLDTRQAELTEREREAARLAAQGLSNKLIAHEMGIGASTVGTLLARAAAKLGAGSRVELVRLARHLDERRA